MMGFLAFIYGVGLAVIGMVGVMSYIEAYEPQERKDGAQMILLAPIWPVRATYWLFKKGIPVAMLTFGRVFVDAIREV